MKSFTMRLLPVGYLFLPLCLTALPLIPAAEAAGGQLVNLRCDDQSNPLGVDAPRPGLSWQLQAGNPQARGLRQSAYHILVASSPEILAQGTGDLWDTGKVISGESHGLPYDGRRLAPGGRVWWKAEAWDGAGESLGWSQPAWWEAGLQNEKNWGGAKWIVAPDSYLAKLEDYPSGQIPLGKWIRRAQQTRLYLAKDFTLRAGETLQNAQVQIQGDDEMEIYLNGKRLATDSSKGWLHLPAIDVTSLVHPAGQVNRLRLLEYASADPDHFLMAVRGGISLQGQDGRRDEILTGNDWKSWFSADPGWTNSAIPGNWGGVDYGSNLHPRLVRRSCYFRKEIELEGEIASARSYTTGRGAYEFHVNGQRVGKDLLTPDAAIKYQYYQVNDITALLKPGKNVLGALTGNSWSNARGYNEEGFNKLRFLARIDVRMKDGATHTFVTGPDWTLSASPLVEDDLQWGERYDARLEQPGWDAPGFDASKWPHAEAVPAPSLGYDDSSFATYYNNLEGESTAPPTKQLVAQPYPPVRVTSELKAVSIQPAGSGKYLYDFGQYSSGRCRLTLHHTQAGDRVVVRYGEVLDAQGRIWSQGSYGDIANGKDSAPTGKAPYNTKNFDVYTCRGADEEVFEPPFTFTGYRYIQLEGTVDSPTVETVVARVMHNDDAVIGRFSCGNDLVNSIWKASYWTYVNDLFAGPVDCPQREKNHWSDYGNDFDETANWYMDNDNLLTYWATGGFQLHQQSVAWEDVYWIVPRDLYLFYDDPRAMALNYDKIKSFVDYRVSQAKGDVYAGMEGKGLYGTPSFLNDWEGDPKMRPDRALFSDAYYYHALDVLTTMATLLGKSGDAQHYNELRVNAQRKFNQRFYDAARGYYGTGRQGEQALVLAFNLPDDAAKSRAAGAQLNAATVAAGYHPLTGMVLTPYLLPQLSAAGFTETAWKTIQSTTYPSWGNMLASGSTTITEIWHGRSLGQSNNHFAFGSVSNWFFRSLGGISFDAARPGFQHFILKPYLPTRLPWAEVEYDSPYGTIRSRWERKESGIEWEVAVPANSTALISIPTSTPAQISEGGRSVLIAPGLKFLQTSEGRCEFAAESGRYRFSWTEKF